MWINETFKKGHNSVALRPCFIGIMRCVASLDDFKKYGRSLRHSIILTACHHAADSSITPPV